MNIVMKNFFKSTVFAVVMFVAISVSAAKKVEVSVDQALGVVNISLKNVSVGEHLIIKDFSGLSLYKKTFREMTNFQKTFSLKGKDNGMYFVEVENDNQIQITPVLKNDQGVTLIEKAARFVFKPQYLREGSVLKLSLLNSNEDDVKITMFSDKGVEIISEGMIHDVVINRKYDTKNLPIGSYTLKVSQGKETFLKSFDVY